MKLQDMRCDDGDEIVESELDRPDDAAPDYPYGLRLTLQADELEKLGLDDALESGEIAVGTTVTVEAKATVVGYAEDESVGDAPRCRLEIQITALAIESDGADRRARLEDERLNALSGSD